MQYHTLHHSSKITISPLYHHEALKLMGTIYISKHEWISDRLQVVCCWFFFFLHLSSLMLSENEMQLLTFGSLGIIDHFALCVPTVDWYRISLMAPLRVRSKCTVSKSIGNPDWGLSANRKINVHNPCRSVSSVFWTEALKPLCVRCCHL